MGVLKSDSASPLHYLVKALVGLTSEEFGYEWTTEDRAYEGLEDGFRPDVILTLKNKRVLDRKHTVFVEVERKPTPGWYERHKAIYKHYDWFVVSLKPLYSETKDPLKFAASLKNQIRNCVEIGTSKPKEKFGPHNVPLKWQRPEKIKKPCRYCGKMLLGVKQHEYKCKQKPKGAFIENPPVTGPDSEDEIITPVPELRKAIREKEVKSDE